MGWQTRAPEARIMESLAVDALTALITKIVCYAASSLFVAAHAM